MDQIEQYQHFSAVFAPSRTDDLLPGAAELIGKRLRWYKAWVIESGPYGGLWACAVLDAHTIVSAGPPFAWAPESDLSEVTL